MSPIGFIGTGTIGGPIALRLLRHNHPMVVFDTSSDALKPLLDKGAAEALSVANVAHQVATVFLSLPGPAQIKDVVLGDDGLLKHLAPQSTIVDLSTNSVSLNRQIASLAASKNIRYLDAPVSGGKQAAQKGSLAVMIGGDENAFNDVKTLIECLGEHIFYMGPPGSGTLTKLINNQIFLSASVLIQEGIVMGAKAGMDPNALLEVMQKCSAGPLLARAPLILSRNFDLNIFSLAIAAKDVGLALESAEDLGASMPMTHAAHTVYTQALAEDLGNEDFFATVKVLEAAAGLQLPALRKANK